MSGTDSLLKLVAAFEAGGVPYMIVGSYSSNFYGIPRMTKDADMVVHLDAQGWRTLPALLPEGIELEEVPRLALHRTLVRPPRHP